MSNKLHMFKNKNKIKFTDVTKGEVPVVTMPDTYTLNKQLMAKEPILTPEELVKVKNELFNFLTTTDYGLLCRERYDFTVFRISNSTSKAIEEIIDVLLSRGEIISIDKQEDDTWEMWIKDSDDAVMYKFFECAWVIDC